MVKSFRRRGFSIIWAAALLTANVVGSGAALAQDCTAEQLANAVDDAGAALREIMRVNQPRLDGRIKALQAKFGWSDADAEDKALTMLADARTAEMDRVANDLLAKIDDLGNVPPRTAPDCTRLQAMQAASIELQAAVKAKSAYLLTRAEGLLAGTQGTLSPAAPPKTAAASQSAPPPTSPPTPKAAAPAIGWATTTTVEPAPSEPAPSPQATAAANTPAGARDDDGYSIDEIVRASSGFFGKVAAGIGSLVEQTFASTGRPTGYILGEEGGGAFLAGLRYGRGTLYLRDGRTMPIFWHGPSIGLDIGGQGAKVMFLVYRLREPEQLMPTYTSVEGSAFIAGGLGVTLMTNGDTRLAPIRSGVGLRVGASVGYVRFTRKPTWNPF